MAVQPTEHLSHTHYLEEEGKLSGQEAGPVMEDTGQLFSNEQNYRGLSGASSHSWAGTTSHNLTLVSHQLMITHLLVPEHNRVGIHKRD